MTPRTIVASAAVNALVDVAERHLWVGEPGRTVREARRMARACAGDLQSLREARIGLVPDLGTGYDIHGPAARALHAAGHQVWVREEELEELGLARPRRQSYDLALRGRLLFPLHGLEGEVGVAGLTLSNARPRWRCHRAVLGLRPPTELVFSAGLDGIPEGQTVAVCADPAAAMRLRSPRLEGWPPISAVVAPASRRLTPAHVSLIAPHAVDGVVDLFIDEEDPRRTRQFTRALEVGGLEVRNVLEQLERAVEQLERSVRSRKAGRQRARPVKHDVVGGGR